MKGSDAAHAAADDEQHDEKHVESGRAGAGHVSDVMRQEVTTTRIANGKRNNTKAKVIRSPSDTPVVCFAELPFFDATGKETCVAIELNEKSNDDAQTIHLLRVEKGRGRAKISKFPRSGNFPAGKKKRKRGRKEKKRRKGSEK